MNFSIKPILLFLFVGITLFTWIMAGLFFYQTSHAAGENTQPIMIHIEKGTSLQQISIKLKNSNLVRSASSFRLLANIKKKHTQIQAGEYKLSQSMLPAEILFAIFCMITVFPVRGGATINPRCPFPIGVIKSMIRVEISFGSTSN